MPSQPAGYPRSNTLPMRWARSQPSQGSARDENWQNAKRIACELAGVLEA